VSEERELVGRDLAAQVAHERVPEAVEAHVHRVHDVLLEYDVAVMAHVRLVFLFGRRRRRLVMVLLLQDRFFLHDRMLQQRQRRRRHLRRLRIGGTVHRDRNVGRFRGRRSRHRTFEFASDPFASATAGGTRRHRVSAQVQRSHLDNGRRGGGGGGDDGLDGRQFGRFAAAASAAAATAHFYLDQVVGMVLMMVVVQVLLLLVHVHLIVDRRQVVVVVFDGQILGVVIDHFDGAFGDHGVHERLGRSRVRGRGGAGRGQLQ